MAPMATVKLERARTSCVKYAVAEETRAGTASRVSSASSILGARRDRRLTALVNERLGPGHAERTLLLGYVIHVASDLDAESPARLHEGERELVGKRVTRLDGSARFLAALLGRAERPDRALDMRL